MTILTHINLDGDAFPCKAGRSTKLNRGCPYGKNNHYEFYNQKAIQQYNELRTFVRDNGEASTNYIDALSNDLKHQLRAAEGEQINHLNKMDRKR